MPTDIGDQYAVQESGSGSGATGYEDSGPASATGPYVAEGGGGVVMTTPQRNVIKFHIFESDLISIGQLNNRVIIYFSIANSFLGLGVAIILGFAFADPNISGLGQFIWRFGPYASFMLSLIMFVAAFVEWKCRRSTVDKIYEEHGLMRTKDGTRPISKP